MLGVDDRLAAVVGPRVRARGRETGAVGAGEREQPPSALALARDRIAEVRPRARDDLDLRGDQLASDPLAQRGVRGRGVAELLEARREVEGRRVENRELLLDPDRQVGCL